MTSPAEPLPEAELTEGTQRSARVQAEMRKRWIYILPAVFVTYSLAMSIARTTDLARLPVWPLRSISATLAQHCLGRSFFSNIFCFTAYARQRERA